MVRAMRQANASRKERLRAAEDRLWRQHPQARLALHRQKIAHQAERLRECLWEQMRGRRRQLAGKRLAVQRTSPARRLADAHRKLLALSARLGELGRKQTAGEHRRFRTLEARLDAMSPLKVMGRGYALVFRARDRQVVRSASQVEVGEAVEIRVAGAGCDRPEDCEQIDAAVTSTRGKRSKE